MAQVANKRSPIDLTLVGRNTYKASWVKLYASYEGSEEFYIATGWNNAERTKWAHPVLLGHADLILSLREIIYAHQYSSVGDVLETAWGAPDTELG